MNIQKIKCLIGLHSTVLRKNFEKKLKNGKKIFKCEHCNTKTNNGIVIVKENV